MPYIQKEKRYKLVAETLESPESPGELNYTITTLCSEYLRLKGVNYTNMNEVIGVLECAKLELYRRVVSPYEDIKIKENGDVY